MIGTATNYICLERHDDDVLMMKKYYFFFSFHKLIKNGNIMNACNDYTILVISVYVVYAHLRTKVAPVSLMKHFIRMHIISNKYKYV